MAAGAARDRFGHVHQQTPGFGWGSATLSRMALLRRKPREGSTTAASGVGPAPAVVKPPRAKRSPKPAEKVEQPPVADEITPAEIAPRVIPTHDDEW